MKQLRILPLLLILAGCQAIYSEQPLGTPVSSLDSGIWQGTWLHEDVVLLTTVLDAEKGTLEAAWVERGSQGAKFERFSGTVNRSGDMLFLNMPNPDTASESTGEYLWARVSNDGRRVILWLPNPKRITEAVKNGELPGVIKDDKNIRLGKLTAEQIQRIGSFGADWLVWPEPLVFIRLAD